MLFMETKAIPGRRLTQKKVNEDITFEPYSTKYLRDL